MKRKLENLNVEIKEIEDQTHMLELQHNVKLILDINKNNLKRQHKSFSIYFDCGELRMKKGGDL